MWLSRFCFSSKSSSLTVFTTLTECDICLQKYVCVCVYDELYANAVLWFAALSPHLCWSELKQLPRLLCLQLLPNCPAIKLLYVYNHSAERTH